MTPDSQGLINGVSRETREKLADLEDLVQKWSKAINLVAGDTLSDIRRRHTEDSLALAVCAPGSGPWLDLGSGAGFPGLVVAILYEGQRPVTLIESDQRKAEFLRAARRELAVPVEIIADRIELAPLQSPEVISARALAPLPELLGLASRHATEATTLLLAKGRNWQAEVDASHADWVYDLHVIEGRSENGSVVLEIKNLCRRST